MKIIVTGSTGFLGKALTARLEERGHEVMRLNSRNCDLARQESLEDFNTPQYDMIYHLAAWTQAGDFCLYHPGEQWIINQRINTNVLDWWQRRQPQAKLIGIGTSCAYAPDRELVEENYLTGVPIDGLFTYAMTKRMLYAGLLALRKQYGLNYLYVVPSTLYGPGYHTGERQLHFIFDLIRKILRGKMRGEPVTLWGDGHQRRELIYIQDFVRILIELSAGCENEIVNVGAGQEFTIRHFARMICDHVGYRFEDIRFDMDKYVGARSKCLGVEKLKKLIPGLSLTPLEIGIPETIRWFQEYKGAALL